MIISRIAAKGRILLLLLQVLIFLLSSATSSVAGLLTAYEQEIFDKLHASKRPFIKVDAVLTQVARSRAADMAHRHYFDHVDPNGFGPNYKVEKAGYKLPDWWGDSASANYIESIAAGQSTPDEVWSDWMGSPPHRKHLMAEDPFYTDETSVGVGYYSDPSSPYVNYWVVITAPPQQTPDLTIISPASGAQVTVPQVGVSGRTGGDGTTAQVTFRVENSARTSEFQAASGIANWSGVASGLAPGANTLRVRSFDSSGTLIAEQARNVTYLVLTPLTVNTSGSGSVTHGFAGTTQRGSGIRYNIAAVPAEGYMFVNWTGSVESDRAQLSFTMAEGFALTANFIPNPFLSARGGYQGVLEGGTAGALGLQVAANGMFTGRLLIGDGVAPLRGRLAADGTAQIDLPNGVHLSLALDLAGGGLTAELSGAVTARVSAGATFRAGQGALEAAGRYTVSLPPPEGSEDASLPQGNGFASLSIGRTGRARMVGALADGRAFSAVAPVTNRDELAVFVRLYGGFGSLNGRVQLRTTDVSDLDGQIHWSKPTLETSRIHPAALEADLPVVGSRFNRPAPGASVLGGPVNNERNLTLSQGNLLQPIVETVVVSAANHSQTARAPLDGVRAVVNPYTGLFSGRFRHPVTAQMSTFRGAIFQKQAAGFGYFLGSDESGNASLASAQ